MCFQVLDIRVIKVKNGSQKPFFIITQRGVKQKSGPQRDRKIEIFCKFYEISYLKIKFSLQETNKNLEFIYFL